MKKLLALLLFVSTAHAADIGNTIIPAVPTQNISASWTNHTLDNAADQIEFLFQCQEACTIDQLCARQGTVTGTPPTYELRLEGISSSGRADGTVKSSSNAKGDLTLGGANTVVCAALTSSYTCSKGEYLASVIDQRTGTIDGSNNAGFSYQNGNAVGISFPASVTVDSSTPTRRTGITPYGYRCSTGAFYGNLMQSATASDFGSGSSPNERGNIFTIPAGSCSTFKIRGMRAQGYVNAAGSSVDFIIYEGTTVRQDTTLDADFVGGTGDQKPHVNFDEDYTFSCGTAYRAVVKPANASGASQGLWYVDYASANHLNSLPLGTSMYYTSRTDAGSFSDTTTRRALIDLEISDITEPSGVTYSRGMGGNLQ